MFMKDAVHMKCTHELAFHSINLLKSENKQKMVWVNAWHLADGDGDIGTNCFESSEKINKIKGVKMFDWSTCQTGFEVVKRHISGRCFHWEVVGYGFSHVLLSGSYHHRSPQLVVFSGGFLERYAFFLYIKKEKVVLYCSVFSTRERMGFSE